MSQSLSGGQGEQQSDERVDEFSLWEVFPENQDPRLFGPEFWFADMHANPFDAVCGSRRRSWHKKWSLGML